MLPGSRAASSMESSASSSGVPPVPRVARKQYTASGAIGNIRSRFAAITCSRGTKPRLSGKGTQRGRLSGTFTRTKRSRFPFASGRITARFNPRLLMNGKGCSASTASGVRIGSTERSK